jgi:flagellar biosynthetic protein FliR
VVPGLHQFPEGQIIAFALIFLRIIAFVVAWPIFGTSLVPVHLKVALALVLTVVLFPTVHFQNVDLIKIGDEVIFLAFREIVVGLFLGFLLRFFFFAVSIAGQTIGISSGLASAQMFNPAMGSQANVMEQAELIMATLFLLAVNGHHLFIQGLAQSFELVPVSSIGIKYEGFASVALAVRECFFMGIKMAAPVMVAIFITNVTMGLLGRAVPQLNVMMTSIQVTIVVSVVVLFLSMPLFVNEMDGLLQTMAERFFSTLKVL